jgi:nucleoside diphosphate kinase
LPSVTTPISPKSHSLEVNIYYLSTTRAGANETENFANQHHNRLGLTDFLSSGPVVCMIWQGKNVVKTARQMLGETDPAKSLPGSIRGDLSIDIGRNVIHGSDSVESAKNEIELWFGADQVIDFKPTKLAHIYE